MIKPHGGRLVDRTVPEKERVALIEELDESPCLSVSGEVARDCQNIAQGVFSPLTGFPNSRDYNCVLDHMRLSDDTPWTIPLILDLTSKRARELEGEDRLAIRHNGSLLAFLEIEEIYPFDRKRHAEAVYGTDDPNHPGVAKTFSRGEYLVGGDIWLLEQPESAYPDFHLLPIETRVLFKEKGWHAVVGFQTRNVPHMGHEYLQKTALSFTDGVMINPVIGRKKPGDFKDDVIIEAYSSLIENYYLRERAVLVTLQFEMRYAGPREAILHAIVRKNHGCTHFIVGRDHAGVGNYYGPFAAQEIFEEFPDLGISPLFFRSFFHCRRCGGVANGKTCPHPESYRVNFSGTKIREMLSRGERPPPEIMRPEIADIVLKWENPFVE
jgi:sulfate adenylyltransferase